MTLAFPADDAPPRSVFITGATGFIGSYVARQYVKTGYAVTVLYRPSTARPERGYGMLTDLADQIQWHEGDVTDIASLEAGLLKAGDAAGLDVIHAAALVSFVPNDRARMEKINVEGTANVVNVCLNAGIRKLGYVSSVAALGRPTPRGVERDSAGRIRISEDQKWEDSPANSAYAQTKYRAELEVWRGIAEGLSAVIVNPSLVFGAGDWSRSSLQLIRYVYDEKPFYPAGQANYVDVLDVAESLYRLMQSDVSAQRFVLSAGTIPYRDLLEQIAAALGKRPPTLAVPPVLTRLLWPLEAVRSWLTGRPPLITRETARSASSSYAFDGRKIEQTLGFQYRPLGEILTRIAAGGPVGLNEASGRLGAS